MYPTVYGCSVKGLSDLLTLDAYCGAALQLSLDLLQCNGLVLEYGADGILEAEAARLSRWLDNGACRYLIYSCCAGSLAARMPAWNLVVEGDCVLLRPCARRVSSRYSLQEDVQWGCADAWTFAGVALSCFNVANVLTALPREDSARIVTAHALAQASTGGTAKTRCLSDKLSADLPAHASFTAWFRALPPFCRQFINTCLQQYAPKDDGEAVHNVLAKIAQINNI